MPGTKNKIMKKRYLSAPLPFPGQKRMFASQLCKALEQYPDKTVFVDLFGGSGLLSHITRHEKPGSTVVYNDYDNYRKRLDNIGRTNALLADLRVLAKDCPRYKRINEKTCAAILRRIAAEEETGFVDYITVSSSLLFSMKYVLNLDSLRKENLFNNIRKSDYSCEGYLDGLEVTSCNYKELFLMYRDRPDVVFLADPPYLNTETGTYRMDWDMKDYLDVLSVLCGNPFIYFTSNKSSILELCEWMESHPAIGNPFRNAVKVEFNARMNYNSTYTDIMLYKRAAPENNGGAA